MNSFSPVTKLKMATITIITFASNFLGEGFSLTNARCRLESA